MNRPRTLLSRALEMTVDPDLSGRVTSLCYRGRELLSGREAHASNWGATYWTSPQSDWGWPPVPEVDGKAYRVARDEAPLHLIGPSVSLGSRRFHIEKKFKAEPGFDAIDVTYLIHNEGPSAFSMASWEISRVPAGGLTFFPTGESAITPIPPHAALPTSQAHGVTFYDHGLFEVGPCRKLHADATGGYLAHLFEDLLLLKIFEDSRPEQQAPGEGECEIFANEDGKYVEIEVQGPYLPVAPGDATQFLIRTAVCELPRGLKGPDRAGLKGFAEEQVLRLRGGGA